MVEDVYEPLAKYRDEFKDRFDQLAKEKFDALVKTSGVDVDANHRLCDEIRRLEKSAESLDGTCSLFTFLAVLAGLALLVAGVLVLNREAMSFPVLPYCIPALAGGLALLVWSIRRRGDAAARLKKLREKIAEWKREAWAQLEPLNALYTWDIPQKLVEATVPRLDFDPFFAAKRLDDLHRLCGWDDAFNDGKSVLGAQSGVINGNPFVIGECLESDWGTQTYTGELEISWQEEEEDSEGHVHLVTRHETLTASVEKPIPVYSNRTYVIYGNDAAPNLAFTRMPNADLSRAGDGFFARMKKKGELSKLEKFSRNLDDDKPYTLMGNREFETLFQTMDRTDEVEYRLLFTALAQRQMLLLLKDDKVGYGDDFSFTKRARINVLEPEHLVGAKIVLDPADFRAWDLEVARKRFLSENAKFFKDAYFALAPILAIPLYQQTRPHAEIWKGVVPESPSSFWEHESLANYYGEDYFRHPDSATRNILKTRVLSREGGAARVEVTAHGYRIEERVDYVTEYGGDGHMHEVPVEWDEYLPVAQAREMALTERATSPSDVFRAGFDGAARASLRRSILSYLAD